MKMKSNKEIPPIFVRGFRLNKTEAGFKYYKGVSDSKYHNNRVT